VPIFITYNIPLKNKINTKKYLQVLVTSVTTVLWKFLVSYIHFVPLIVEFTKNWDCEQLLIVEFVDEYIVQLE